MSIKFKSLLKAQPGVAGGGVKKYYATIVTDGEATVDELVKDIEKFSSLSEPDIRGVILALENVIQTKLSEGRIVRLEKLGSLYPTLSSEGVEKETDVTSSIIKEVGINYRPGDRLKKAINDAGFKKVSG
jgi:predicted histone-like DNA-binding protein